MFARALALLLAGSTMTQAAPDPGSSLAIERRLASHVTRDTALALVRELVSFGPRMGGTPSGDRASARVAELMGQLGLEVTVLVDPPRAVHYERAWEVSLGDRRLPSAWPYGFSPSIAAVTAPLVADVNDGPEGEVPAEAAGRSLEGAVVLTGRRPAVIYESMAKRGAVAVLTDHGTGPERYRTAAPIGELQPRAGTAAAIPVFGLSYEDGLDLRRALAARGSVSLRVSLDATTTTGSPRTVVGTLPGAGKRRRELLMVCAHGDSDAGGPGADDNASGVASLIEVARALGWAAREGLLPADRPEVLFIVWGSEYHSSEAWVTAHPGEMRRLRAVFNYDQTGTGAERDAVYYEGNDIPWNGPLLRLLERIAGDHAGVEGFWTAYTSNPALSGTDAYSFLPGRYKGRSLTRRRIPSTTVFTSAWDRPTIVKQTPGWRSPGWPEPGDLFIDYSAVYHSSGDLPAATTEAEPWNMERCARLVALAIFRLMGGGGSGRSGPTR